MSSAKKRPVPPPLVGEPHGGDFGVYMQHKIQRLHAQLNEKSGEEDVPISRIFEGMVFFINGFTPLPVEELRALVHEHGGHVAAYETSNVTHILCTNLPHAKLKQRRAQKLARGAHQQLPVIHPDYILASIEQGRRLPPADFLVDGVKYHHGQGIQAFMPRRCGDGGARRAASALHGPALDLTTALATEGTAFAVPADTPVSNDDAGWNASEAHQELERATVLGPVSPAATAVEETSQTPPRSPSPSSSPGPSTALPHREERMTPPYHTLAGGSKASWSPLSPPLPSPSTTPSSRSRPTGRRADGGQNAAGSVTGGLLSTKEDPDFIKKYFKSSRLHFIGSFRARMQDLAAEHARARRAARAVQSSEAGESNMRHCQRRLIMHVDMDCYFVSALVRDRPELAGKPVAVAHGEGQERHSSSEISSCNYPARATGVRAGMFVGEAQRLCPGLKVLHYDFEVYERVSRAMYQIFFEEAEVVQPVSCDEAYLELAAGTDPEAAARRVRRRLMEATRCPASAGVGRNMLLARLATKHAKPNGHHVMLGAEESMVYLENLPVREIPGVGWESDAKLERRGLRTCGQLWEVRLPQLQSWLGPKTGSMLYRACRGQDDRPVVPQTTRKSVGAEVNWGVRFSQEEQVEVFVDRLAVEVAQRLAQAKVQARHLTFKIKRSQYGPNEPEKLLGCGRCDNLSRSVALARPTDGPADIAAVSLRLLAQLQVPPALIRGLGIQLSNLLVDGQAGVPDKKGAGSMQAWLQKTDDLSGVGSRGFEEDGCAVSASKQGQSKEPHDLVVVGEEEEAEKGGHDAWRIEEEGPCPGRIFAPGCEELEGDGLSTLVQEHDLPPPSQIDLSVLPELPSPMRLELEQHLRQQKERQQSKPIEQQHGDRRQSEGEEKRQDDADSSLQHWDVSMSQIDETTFQALPRELQDEVRAAVRRKSFNMCRRNGVHLDTAGGSTNHDAHGERAKGKASNAPGLTRATHSPSQRDRRAMRQMKIPAYDSNGLQLRGLSDQDAAFLAQLPVSLRTETLAELDRHKRTNVGLGSKEEDSNDSFLSSSSRSPRVSTRGHPCPTSGRHPRTVFEVEDEENDRSVPPTESPEVYGRPRLFVCEDIHDVRRALIDWLGRVGTVEEGVARPPATAHMQLLSVYLLELLDDDRDSDAWTLMRSFRRWVMQQGHQSWFPAYGALLKVVETRLSERELRYEYIQQEPFKRPARAMSNLKWGGLQLNVS